MYVQPAAEGPFARGGRGEPVFVPEGYSGSAFERASEAPEVAEAPAAEEESAPAAEEAPVTAEAPAEEAAPTSGGIFSRVPLLSSLLPPRRRSREGGSNDLLTLGLLFLLLREDGENDLLPLLLLLLFWN